MSKTRPLILITPSLSIRGAEFSDLSYSLSTAYAEAIWAAGGAPMIASFDPGPDSMRAAMEKADGLLMSGGEDVEPRLYAPEVPPELADTMHLAGPLRDHAELCLIAELFRQRKPLLAICRGHQLLNVAFGGTLYLDLARQRPGQPTHRGARERGRFDHQIILRRGSLLARIFGSEKIAVNSSHHQAICKLAPMFEPTATSPDGLVEAMELAPDCAGTLPYCVSVQFHPERLFERRPEFLLLFRSLIWACNARRSV